VLTELKSMSAGKMFQTFIILSEKEKAEYIRTVWLGL